MGAPSTSVSHDEVLLWLSDCENRDKVRRHFGMRTIKKFNGELESLGLYLEHYCENENRIYLPYQPLRYPDVLEIWNIRYLETNKAKDTFLFIWEAKPPLWHFGEIIRQIKEYAELVPQYLKSKKHLPIRDENIVKIIVFNAVRHKQTVIQQLFTENNNIFLYQLLREDYNKWATKTS